MSCGMGLIKYLLFIFNFIFALCGLAILVVGVLIHFESSSYKDAVENGLNVAAVLFIIIGSIVFIIAFFGCCGAIRESHCMTITFAAFLLTLLIIQVAMAIYVFVVFKESNIDVTKTYTQLFDDYWNVEVQRETVDVIQTNLHCCGIESPADYRKFGMNGTIPSSCCEQSESSQVCTEGRAFRTGCAILLKEYLFKAGKIIGGVALGIAAVEFVGIVFSLCLANSIKEMDRRHYRV